MQKIDILIEKISQNILNPLILLFAGIAMVYFLWGVFEFIRDYDSADARSKGVQHMLWGVIGMFIMFSVFGIMNLIASTIKSI
jgi:succinate dehydrogenase hydrophobic anchor subunit